MSRGFGGKCVGRCRALIKILQFGEGNFLRSFADVYFQALNEQGGDYHVHVVQPVPAEVLLDIFQKQGCRYHVVLRGMQDGRPEETVHPVSAIDAVISPFSDPEAFFALAQDKDLKIILSNTTEAGICYNEADAFDGFEQITFPAKLTKFLYARFVAGGEGVYLLPVELIENNADALYACVDKYIRLWGLPGAFKEWNDRENFYCNTLVDRIVSGYPRDEQTRAHLTDLIGQADDLMSVGEPFGLWAVEKKGAIEDYIKAGVYNIEVVLTEDIAYYKKRKVRVLNGSHTNLVPMGLVLGKSTVYDCMTDQGLYAFFKNALAEIIPFVSSDVAMTEAFAADVEQRFFNPFLNHQLTSIALNSISKWKARVLPSFKDFYEKNGHIPPHLTEGFSYLMYLYATRYDRLQDEKAYLDFFAAGKPVGQFMADKDIWGEDLTAYEGFVQAVEEQMQRIRQADISA